jgi:hypothetical protein
MSADAPTMRVLATSTMSTAREAPAARKAAGGGFSLGEGADGTRRSGSVQLQAIGGIESLVALQGVDDVSERRRRAVRTGRGALDALDALKLGLIGGSLDQGALGRLHAAAGELGQSTGDPGLDAVLSEIALRVEVEIAKLSRR